MQPRTALACEQKTEYKLPKIVNYFESFMYWKLLNYLLKTTFKSIGFLYEVLHKFRGDFVKYFESFMYFKLLKYFLETAFERFLNEVLHN